MFKSLTGRWSDNVAVIAHLPSLWIISLRNDSLPFYNIVSDGMTIMFNIERHLMKSQQSAGHDWCL